MHNSKYIQGKFIKIHQLNDFFNHVSIMLLEHFDKIEYDNTLIIVGSCVVYPYSKFKSENPNHKIIVYQLEQMMGGSNWHSINYISSNFSGCDTLWDYDPMNVFYIKEYHNLNVDKLLPMLYTKSLDKIENKEYPSIDVLFYGFINERRFKILNNIQSNTYNTLKIAWIYGEPNVDRYIADSKVILNLHAFEPWNRQEQVRMFYPLINGKTIVSEPSQTNHFDGMIVESQINNLASDLVRICYDGSWRRIGAQGKVQFIEKTQKYLEQNKC
jgi:hypothetical protein